MRLRHQVSTLALGLVVTGASTFAQDIQLENEHTRWRVMFEQIDLDGPGDDLGLLGIHYDLLGVVDAIPPLYVGIGGFAEVTGENDGYLLAGLTVGGVWEPVPDWQFDTGVFVGGGGGGDSVPGTGLAAQPFFAVERSFGLYGLRAEVAYFDTDDFEGDWTASLGISLASELLRARESRQRGRIPADAIVRHQVRVTPRTLWLRPDDDSRTRSGDTMDVDIGTIGLGLDYFVNDFVYFPVEAYGAVRGAVDGFVMASAGVGLSLPVTQRASFEIAASGVTGGGGNVSTGGGLGWHARAGLRAVLTPSLSLELMGGLLEFPDGDFGAETASIGLSWSAYPVELALNYPRGNLAREGLSSADAEVRGTRLFVQNKFYSPTKDAISKSGAAHEGSIGLLGVGIEEPITANVDLTARVAAAYDGDIGGYSEGLLGARYDYTMYQFPGHHLELSAEVGAAGGGGADVGSGLVAHFAIGWRYDVTEDAQFDLSFGKLEANHGSFEAETITVGLTWDLSRAVLRD